MPPRTLDQLGDEIAELSVHLEAATARLLDLIREFDARDGWNNGFRSCAHWLAWRVGLDWARRASASAWRARWRAAAARAALARGELSYAKVRALTRVATPRRKSACWRSAAPARRSTSSASCAAGGASTARPRPARPRLGTRAGRCMCIQDADGTVVVRGRLEPEAGAMLLQALTAAREALYKRANAAPHQDDVSAETPSWLSGGPTRWSSSPRPRSITGSTPVRRASAIRSSSMSMPMCSPTPRRLASPSWKAVRAFPRKRRGVWRAIRAGW